MNIGDSSRQAADRKVIAFAQNIVAQVREARLTSDERDAAFQIAKELLHLEWRETYMAETAKEVNSKS